MVSIDGSFYSFLRLLVPCTSFPLNMSRMKTVIKPTSYSRNPWLLLQFYEYPYVQVDKSNFAIGCVLTQLGKHDIDYPISFASHQLNNTQLNYTTLERERLAMIYAIKKSWYYLLSSKFVFYVDHIKHCFIFLIDHAP